MNPLTRYARWLHTGFPSGTVERLPVVDETGATSVPGVYVVGDLAGPALLKLAADSGARAVQTIIAGKLTRVTDDKTFDLVIIGGGVAGIAAALEAQKNSLRFAIIEAAQPLFTLENFPKHKPIFTYPVDFTPTGKLTIEGDVKETLLASLHAQLAAAKITPQHGRVARVRRDGDQLRVDLDGKLPPLIASRVIVAIGRSGDFRRLGVPGEAQPHVFNRLFDANDQRDRNVVVVGGGDSAVEAAIALANAGAKVTLSYRKSALGRPKPENQSRLAELVLASKLKLQFGTTPTAIEAASVKLLDQVGVVHDVPADVVFVLIGRAAPLDFFRRSGIAIAGAWRAQTVAAFAAFFALCCFVFTWKSGGAVTQFFSARHWFPFNVPDFGATALGQTLTLTLRQPGFYYSLVYTIVVVLFGVQRVRRRQTPYVKWQTLTLALVQVLPLFLLPYFVLPLMGHAGFFDAGVARQVADQLFPLCNYDHGREYWRSFGFVLAWPLFIWNFFSPQPLFAWLAIGLVQTFVIIPLIVWRWGKGAYCGWICSCGALAETLGDTQRQKMPHGPAWNRVNLVGQVILAAALILFVARTISWIWPGGAAQHLYDTYLSSGSFALDYYHIVDIGLAGIVGVGMYFWFSGRVWCRFFCPLAALMHIYARFSRFRIFADKPKCISCNACTSACHQGIDVMSFAQRGAPMDDPECVRCSACVTACPTNVLSFGAVDKHGKPTFDRVLAQNVRRLPIVR